MDFLKTSEGIQYGYGLFETLKVIDGQIQNLEDHYQRLSKGLKYLSMENISLNDFESSIVQEYQGCQKSVVKVTCLKEKNRTRLVLSSRENPYTLSDYSKGYKVKKSIVPRHSLNDLLQYKTTNYMQNILEKKTLTEEGFQESIHYNEKREITEGVFSNVFFIKDKQLYTADVSCGLLPGIQRKKILKAIKKLGLSFEIGYYKEEDIWSADEVFFTNAVIGIMPVSQYEDCSYDLNKNHITKSLMEAYENGLL